MLTISALIFYILLIGAGGFAWYCSRLSLKKSLAHLLQKQHFSAFTFYALHLIAAVMATVVISATVGEFLLVLTGTPLAPATYTMIMIVVITVTIIGTVMSAHKPVMGALKAKNQSH
ncbi:hypothetical protein GCM10007916_35300 [Psychromonas marina]|uniref:Uncharacterized protein n=1 Tax=Psychromonas marina TaxID=88364 RepID=A0ABQ6E5I0_9GAMM|nr:hypothetical protein [Psychromonas marina]GLS92458.1 hypothetical protein GCM10007916_35300 [Psychromonas marina]